MPICSSTEAFYGNLGYILVLKIALYLQHKKEIKITSKRYEQTDKMNPKSSTEFKIKCIVCDVVSRLERVGI